MIETVQEIALSRALKALDAIGAQYAVQYKEQTYGELTVAFRQLPLKLRKDGLPHYRRGATRAHYWPYLEGMKPSDVTAIPYGDFDPRVLVSNVISACIHAWGKGSYIAHRDDAASAVHVLRMF